jgi:cell surface protein SprA
MRFFSNPDFEAANYEFIDFWVLNPFMDRPDGIKHVEGETGEIVFQLGNVSEDIYKDNLQFYENGMPLKSDPNAQKIVINTRMGRVPINVPVANGFDRGDGEEQDTGYDGLDDEDERSRFATWLSEMASFAGQPVRYLTEDPSADNFRYFGDRTFPETVPLLSRLTQFNNPQGNAPLRASQGGDQTFLRGNRFPESEDLNNNRSLDQGESYYNYVLKVQNKGGKIDSITAGSYYKQVRRIVNANGVEEFWYRFQIPLTSGQARNISGFRSIQFMRMYFTKFSTGKTFRFADFQMVRSSWRRSPNQCAASDANPNNIQFSIDEVGVEENSGKLPFNYLTPRGIKQERLFGTLTNLLQDEKSISLNFCRLDKNCQVSVNKLTKLNLNLYKKLQLFVHLESKDQEPIQRGKLAIFVRLGKDMVNNYYEYEMPLRDSPRNFPSATDSIWLQDNFIDITLSKFKDLKKAKIKDGILEIADPDVPGAKLRIKGIPSLGLVRVVEIGVRNLDQNRIYCGEVWINELRATGLSEDGGFAAQARMQAQMADLGELNITGNLSTIGFGGIDKRLQERAQEEVYQYTVSTNLNLGKLLPKALPINLPFLAQYSKSSTTPLYDPYQLDLTVDEVAAVLPEGQRAGVYERARETSTIKSVNLTNVKIEKGDGKMPWSPNNLTANYSYNETKLTDPVIEQDLTSESKIDLEYNYSTNGYSIQPLKKLNSKWLKLISEFNFNPLPNRIGFNTGINRYKNIRAFRFPEVPVFQFDDQRFKWDRNYNVDWELTKSLRLTFSARSSAIVDELRQVGIADNPVDRNWVNELGQDFTQQVRQNQNTVSDYRNDNLKDLGRTKNYKHNINLTYSRLPFQLIPLLDWISGSADYQAEYNWNGGALIYIDELGNLLGNTIQNTQTRSANATLAFDKLYAKSSYLKRLEAEGRAPATRAKTRSRNAEENKESVDKAAEAKEKVTKDRKSGEPRQPSVAEKILIRPLLSLRSVKLSYREDLGTSIPGFMPQADLFGLNDGVSPGWSFAAGFQPNIEKGDPNNYLMNNKGWFNSSANFNDQIIQNERQAFSGKVSIEPYRSLVLDLDFVKNYRKDHTEVFKSKDKDFMQLARYDLGSFEYTNYGMNTIFENSKDLYARFKSYRVTVSERLPNQQGAGKHPDHPEYAQGYGPTSYAVNVPAFLAAYTGQSIDKVSNSIEKDVKALSFIPKPNWSLRYDGLSKLPFFQDFVSSFTLRHAYKSTVGVGRFNTAPDFIESNPYLTNISNNNYYAQLEIPAVTIQESFSPLIGVQMRTKSNLNLNFEVKRTRNLDLRLNANELGETTSSEIVFGSGYTIQNFKGFTKSNKKRKPKAGTANDGGDLSLSKVNPLQPAKNRTLAMNVDFSIRDDRTDIFRLENDIDPQAQRGQKAIAFKPNIEYQMYKNLTIRLFADYSKSIPYVLNAFPITRLQAGTTVKFIFQ